MGAGLAVVVDDGKARPPGIVEQGRELVDEARVAGTVQVVDHPGAGVLTAGPPDLEQGIELAAALLRQRLEVAQRLLGEHIEVAHRPQHPPGALQATLHGPHRLGIEIGTEHAQGGPHAARGDAHVVQVFGIVAGTRAGLVLAHLGEVEAQRLEGSVGHGVGGDDARVGGRLDDRAAGGGGGELPVGRGPDPEPFGELRDEACGEDSEPLAAIAVQPVAHRARRKPGAGGGLELSRSLVQCEQRPRSSADGGAAARDAAHEALLVCVEERRAAPLGLAAAIGGPCRAGPGSRERGQRALIFGQRLR